MCNTTVCHHHHGLLSLNKTEKPFFFFVNATEIEELHQIVSLSPFTRSLLHQQKFPLFSGMTAQLLKSG